MTIETGKKRSGIITVNRNSKKKDKNYPYTRVNFIIGIDACIHPVLR